MPRTLTLTDEQYITLLNALEDARYYRSVADQAKVAEYNALLDTFDQAPAPDDVWAEHPLYSRSSWQYEVGNGDTNQGYWDWCALQAQDDDNPANQEAP